MTKYLLKRLLHGLISVVIVVGIVMLLIYSLMDRDLIFASDSQFSKKQSNARETYKNEKWEAYGYLDYVTFTDYIVEQNKKGQIDEQSMKKVTLLPRTPQMAQTNDSFELFRVWAKKFKTEYEGNGYTIVWKDFDTRAKQPAILYAYKNIPVLKRLGNYFLHLLDVDNVHYVEETTGEKLENTGIRFTFFDPAYNSDPDHKVFSPAIIGNGTKHKYLLYFDGEFPYIHQNLVNINLGLSYSVNKDIDIYNTLTDRQDPNKSITVTFPTGLTEESPRNIHTATYVQGSRDSLKINSDRFTDDYTNVQMYKTNMSRTGFSFVIGLISVALAYFLGVPLGILMARKKNTWIDNIGTIYVIFIIAVPSLAYIFFFREIGGNYFGLPKSFDLQSGSMLMYVLPVISLALPSIASLMKWIRRYMIDQQNSDYVKFARSGGLSENEIFRKHILKNAIIPIVHGIPGSILGSLVGAIITESIYRVPGAGYLLTTAINQYDNGVIVGLTLFYSLLSIVSLILGDILMTVVDPRISFTEKAR